MLAAFTGDCRLYCRAHNQGARQHAAAAGRRRSGAKAPVDTALADVATAAVGSELPPHGFSIQETGGIKPWASWGLRAHASFAERKALPLRSAILRERWIDCVFKRKIPRHRWFSARRGRQARCLCEYRRGAATLQAGCRTGRVMVGPPLGALDWPALNRQHSVDIGRRRRGNSLDRRCVSSAFGAWKQGRQQARFTAGRARCTRQSHLMMHSRGRGSCQCTTV